MKLNVGIIDRGVRITAGVAAIVLGIIYQSWWGAIGLVPLVTALFFICSFFACRVHSRCGKEG
jgi:hypothetical protein